MTDYATIEALASRLCHDAGRNWYAKGCKRNHWRKLAKVQIEKATKTYWWMFS